MFLDAARLSRANAVGVMGSGETVPVRGSVIGGDLVDAWVRGGIGS